MEWDPTSSGLLPFARASLHNDGSKRGRLMKCVPALTAKTLEDAGDKELLMFEFNGATVVAAKLQCINDFTTLIAVFGYSGDHQDPHILYADNGTRCASFGTEWTLELLPSPEAMTYPAEFDKAGTVVIASEGTAIRLAGDPSDSRPQGIFLMLDRWQGKQRLTASGLGVRRWRIWPSEEERTNPNAAPIVDFNPHQVT